jgi:hypothetical protein
MNCKRCRKSFPREEKTCPHCGESNPSASGVFQTSTVLISAGPSRQIFRSVDEVPNRLRAKLVKSTSSPNSATILIADRRGRREIARAMRATSGQSQRGLIHAILGQSEPQPPVWLSPRRKRVAIAILVAGSLIVLLLVLGKLGL